MEGPDRGGRDLASHSVRARQHFTVDNNAAPNTGSERDQDEFLDIPSGSEGSPCEPTAHAIRVTLPSPADGMLTAPVSPATPVCERGRLVLLAYYGGASRQQLAVQFDKPVNTIKTWLRRALMDIRECLGS